MVAAQKQRVLPSRDQGAVHRELGLHLLERIVGLVPEPFLLLLLAQIIELRFELLGAFGLRSQSALERGGLPGQLVLLASQTGDLAVQLGVLSLQLAGSLARGVILRQSGFDDRVMEGWGGRFRYPSLSGLITEAAQRGAHNNNGARP